MELIKHPFACTGWPGYIEHERTDEHKATEFPEARKPRLATDCQRTYQHRTAEQPRLCEHNCEQRAAEQAGARQSRFV